VAHGAAIEVRGFKYLREVFPLLRTLHDSGCARDHAGNRQLFWKLHAHFEIEKYVPVRVDVTSPLNGGAGDEAAMLRKSLQKGRCYVLDRYYAQFALFNEIHAIDSSYVCRVRDNSTFEVTEERELSDEASNDGIVRDVIVNLGTASKQHKRPDHPVRLIEVQSRPHEKRGGRKGKTAGPPSQETLLIATDLLTVPVDVIALIYRYR
jgi:hypothetical protein